MTAAIDPAAVSVSALIAALKGGYYNSGPYSVTLNPGGLMGGHDVNFPGALLATARLAEATALDAAATAADRIATAADSHQTGQDRIATAADRVATGQDRAATAQARTDAVNAVASIAGGPVPSARSIGTAAGSGLTGGGSLAVDRALALDVAGLTAKAAPTGSDKLVIADMAAGGASRTALVSSIVSLAAPSVSDTAAEAVPPNAFVYRDSAGLLRPFTSALQGVPTGVPIVNGLCNTAKGAGPYQIAPLRALSSDGVWLVSGTLANAASYGSASLALVVSRLVGNRAVVVSQSPKGTSQVQYYAIPFGSAYSYTSLNSGLVTLDETSSNMWMLIYFPADSGPSSINGVIANLDKASGTLTFGASTYLASFSGTGSVFSSCGNGAAALLIVQQNNSSSHYAVVAGRSGMTPTMATASTGATGTVYGSFYVAEARAAGRCFVSWRNADTNIQGCVQLSGSTPTKAAFTGNFAGPIAWDAANSELVKVGYDGSTGVAVQRYSSSLGYVSQTVAAGLTTAPHHIAIRGDTLWSMTSDNQSSCTLRQWVRVSGSWTASPTTAAMVPFAGTYDPANLRSLVDAKNCLIVWHPAWNALFRVPPRAADYQEPIGFSVSGGAAGSQVSALLPGGVIGGFSGLTAGAHYWLGYDGIPTTNTEGRYLGVATSATTIHWTARAPTRLGLSTLIISSGTFTVPAGVFSMSVRAAATQPANQIGGAEWALCTFPVVPGEVLGITIGARGTSIGSDISIGPLLLCGGGGYYAMLYSSVCGGVYVPGASDANAIQFGPSGATTTAHPSPLNAQIGSVGGSNGSGFVEISY